MVPSVEVPSSHHSLCNDVELRDTSQVDGQVARSTIEFALDHSIANAAT